MPILILETNLLGDSWAGPRKHWWAELGSSMYQAIGFEGLGELWGMFVVLREGSWSRSWGLWNQFQHWCTLLRLEKGSREGHSILENCSEWREKCNGFFQFGIHLRRPGWSPKSQGLLSGGTQDRSAVLLGTGQSCHTSWKRGSWPRCSLPLSESSASSTKRAKNSTQPRHKSKESR